MINGITVALPTFNHLDHLKRCLYSLRMNSVLPDTEVSIFVDGSTDGTIEWLQEAGIAYNSRAENKGAFSGWNEAVKHCRNEFFIIGEDDTFFGPSWDRGLAKWQDELGNEYIIMPQLVEPIKHGSYVEGYFGDGLEDFDEDAFMMFCNEHFGRHEIIPTCQGFMMMRKGLFDSMGGFDEIYDPGTRGTMDLMLRMHYAYPNLRWVRVWDVMLYHFVTVKHKTRDIYTTDKFHQKHLWNVKHFEEKYKLNSEQAYALLPVGLK